jgi:hypothetical protein
MIITTQHHNSSNSSHWASNIHTHTHIHISPKIDKLKKKNTHPMIALKTDVLQNKIYPEISFCSLVVAAIIRTCSLRFLLHGGRLLFL